MSFDNLITIPASGKKEIIDLIAKEYIESGYFKEDILIQLPERIKNVVNNDLGFSTLFSHNDLLTLAEKKNLGLPTRKKISREMIYSLSEKGKKLEDPKGTLENIFERNFNMVYKKYEYLEMEKKLSKKDAFFSGYRVIASLTKDTCIVCGTFDNTVIKSVDDLSTFKNFKCKSSHCAGCIFVPVMKGMEDDDNEMSYVNWLKELPMEEQKEILGEYYDLYKKGKSLKDIMLSIKI